MSRSWKREILAVFRKEIAAEARGRAGWLTSLLFGVSAVVGVSFSTTSAKLSPALAGGLLWVILLFAATVVLPRTFTTEEETGTGDLLRLWARPHAVFWGKALFNLAFLLVISLPLVVLFSLLTDLAILRPGLMLAALLGTCGSLAGGVTLCGALVSQASQRSFLASAISLPLLIPILAMGVTAFRAVFESVAMTSGPPAALGLICYAVASLAIGPYLFAAVWRR